MRAKISEKERYAAIILREEGLSMREIGRKLGKHHTCIRNILNRYSETGRVIDRHRSGRPTIATARDVRALTNLVKKNRRASSTTLAADWVLSCGKKASPRTVRRRLLDNDFLWRAAAKKPRLSTKQKATRVKFCREHKAWTKSMWSNVIFSDEMNIEVDCRKGRIMMRRRPNERLHQSCIVSRTKQGSGYLLKSSRGSSSQCQTGSTSAYEDMVD